MGEQCSKSWRILSIYDRLRKGETILKKYEADRFGVDEKTIQRDIDELRTYMTDTFYDLVTIDYDRQKRGYVWREKEMKQEGLENEHILILSKILLESRALKKEEMNELLDKLISLANTKSRSFIENMIKNERFHYVSLRHNKPIICSIWDLSEAVYTKKMVVVEYKKEGSDETVTRKLKPMGIVFSEYYFYLIAFLTDYEFDFPTIYRIDRIVRYEVTDERFKLNYATRFEEGEFRKRVQFMQPGELMKITFRFWGPSLQAILDRLPTAKVIGKDGQAFIIEAEVYGRGIKMWLLSQAQFLEVMKPKEFREEMRKTIEEMLGNYTKV
ncbi:WYL domain-containing protein [Anoxybacillus ayderensis]|uniref:helix-turn-helix transcriptional regulator n=1 Tax=Anoxybacillus ayderensis TaxID=265546 RepID=UPI002E22267F|nr:WYL domain-containing protein [Anoxybacillus ayderensis]